MYSRKRRIDCNDEPERKRTFNSNSLSNYSSDESEVENHSPGFVNSVSSFIKSSIVDSSVYKRISNMFSQNSSSKNSQDNKNNPGSSSSSSSENLKSKSLLNSNFRNSLNRPSLDCYSRKKSFDANSSPFHDKTSFTFSTSNPFVKNNLSNSFTRSTPSKTSSVCSDLNGKDDDVIILPIPVIKTVKSSKKIFKNTSNVQQNSGAQVHKSKYPLHRKVYKSSPSMKVYNSTAKESIRIAERDKYKQLLQQYTAMPVMSNFSSQRSSRSNSITSLCESSSSSVKEVPVTPFLSKSRLDKDSSRYLSSRLKSLNKYYLPSSTPMNSYQSKKKPIFIDLEDSNSSQQPEIVELKPSAHKIKKSFETEHPPIIVSRKDVMEEKVRQYPFFSREWTERMRKELDEVSMQLKPLIEKTEVEIETYKKQRDDRNVEFLEKLRKQLRKPKLSSEEVEVEVEADEGFIELTDEMEQKIDEALIPSPPDQLLVEAFNLTIRRRDIETLANLNWLNDEIINFYFNLLVDRGKNDNFPSVYAFNSFFYPKLMSSGHPALKRWTRKVDIFSHQFIIIPVHLGMHWCLAIINFKAKEICYYDSLGNSNKDCLMALKKYLHDESLDKKKQSFDTTDWSLITTKDIPQQMNGSDCGMFACIYAEYITRESKITFTQEDMPYFRRRMVYEILTKKLL